MFGLFDMTTGISDAFMGQGRMQKYMPQEKRRKKEQDITLFEIK